MKKIVLLLLIILLFFTGCSFKKQVLSFDKFQDFTIMNEYQFTDITSQVDNSDITEAGMASTSTWHVEFYHLKSVEDAKRMFNYNKSNFQNNTSVKTLQVESNGLNYHYYTLTTTKAFMYVCQVDDTLLYASAPVEYRKRILNFIKELGY